jgi:hypothetical protein
MPPHGARCIDTQGAAVNSPAWPIMVAHSKEEGREDRTADRTGGGAHTKEAIRETFYTDPNSLTRLSTHRLTVKACEVSRT